MSERLLAVIPARGGSKGLPGKNLRPLAGLPLIGHSILFAQMCPQIDRCIVSTDVQEIADVSRRLGAEVPFLRPQELAQDETPIWPVIRHALAFAEEQEGRPYDLVLLLDPTSPGRDPSDVAGALRRLSACPSADGVIGVSRPDFNPAWNCVVEQEGWMVDLLDGASRYARRQEVPVIYRIHGSVYLWRSAFVRRQEGSWRHGGRYLTYETPERRSMSIDTADEFARAEVLITHGFLAFPWLQGTQMPADANADHR